MTIEHDGPVEIRQTLAGWSLETSVDGEPDRLRLHAPMPVLPCLGRFEVAVPVVERQTTFDTQAAQETATQSAPPVPRPGTLRPREA